LPQNSPGHPFGFTAQDIPDVGIQHCAMAKYHLKSIARMIVGIDEEKGMRLTLQWQLCGRCL
jgi:hypothetical protein